MPAPSIVSFGDGDHEAGETGLVIAGANFGAFAGSAWIYENADLTGTTDELTIQSWADLSVTVDIPASLNNTTGTRYLFLQREDLAWSFPFSFTLSEATIPQAGGHQPGGHTPGGHLPEGHQPGDSGGGGPGPGPLPDDQHNGVTLQHNNVTKLHVRPTILHNTSSFEHKD